MEKGLLFVVSAPAGCGKDTILEQLFKVTENVGYSVSATSRAPREGEVDGVHYHFRTREQFEQMIKNEEVLEYTEYCGNYYGTPRKAVEDMLNAGNRGCNACHEDLWDVMNMKDGYNHIHQAPVPGVLPGVHSAALNAGA